MNKFNFAYIIISTLIILGLIIGIYYGGKIPKEDMSICLLGTYILLKGTFDLIYCYKFCPTNKIQTST